MGMEDETETERKKQHREGERERAAGGSQMSNVRLLMCVTLILCHFVCVRQAEKTRQVRINVSSKY